MVSVRYVDRHSWWTKLKSELEIMPFEMKVWDLWMHCLTISGDGGLWEEIFWSSCESITAAWFKVELHCTWWEKQVQKWVWVSVYLWHKRHMFKGYRSGLWHLSLERVGNSSIKTLYLKDYWWCWGKEIVALSFSDIL